MTHAIIVPLSWISPRRARWRMVRSYRREAPTATRLCRFVGCDDDASPCEGDLALCPLHRSFVEQLGWTTFVDRATTSGNRS